MQPNFRPLQGGGQFNMQALQINGNYESGGWGADGGALDGWDGRGILGDGVRPHRNMTPDYRGQPKQGAGGVYSDARMDLLTGRVASKGNKREGVPLFNVNMGYDPDASNGNRYDATSRDMSRVVPSNRGRRDGELPFDQIRMGPNTTAQGRWGSAPAEGFHPSMRIMPKIGEELWVNPKTELGNRINGGAALVGMRPQIGRVELTTRVKAANNLGGRFILGGFARDIAKRQVRPSFYLKPVSRGLMDVDLTGYVRGPQQSSPWMAEDLEAPAPPRQQVGGGRLWKKWRGVVMQRGGGGGGEGGGGGDPFAQGLWTRRKWSATRGTTRTTYWEGDMKHAILESNQDRHNDYGKVSYRVTPTNRAGTEALAGANRMGNLQGAYEKRVTGILDKLGPTRKSELIHNPRPLGNIQSSYKGAPVFSPRAQMPRTTLRDLYKVINHIGGAAPVIYRAPTDQNADRSINLNEFKETTLVGRKQAPLGAHLTNGADWVSMTTSKIQRVNNYDASMGGVHPNQQRAMFGYMEPKRLQFNELNNLRFKPKVSLASLKGNPLTLDITQGNAL